MTRYKRVRGHYKKIPGKSRRVYVRPHLRKTKKESVDKKTEINTQKLLDGWVKEVK